jgi:hypothetical protein
MATHNALTLYRLFGSNFYCAETSETIYVSRAGQTAVASLDETFTDPAKMESAEHPDTAAMALMRRVHGARTVVIPAK